MLVLSGAGMVEVLKVMMSGRILDRAFAVLQGPCRAQGNGFHKCS